MAEIWGIAAAAVGAAGSMIASKQASSAQTGAANKSLAEQQRQFDLMRQDTALQRATGDQALNRLWQLFGYGGSSTPQVSAGGATSGSPFPGASRVVMPDGTIRDIGGGMQVTGSGSTSSGPDASPFFTSPGYAFNLAQGQQAIERSAAARGGLASGNTLAATSQFAQGLASQEYNNYVNQLMAQAGLGQTATNTAVNAGANAAGNMANINMAAGNARASGIMTAGTGINNAIQGGISNYLMSQYMGGQQPGYTLPSSITNYGGLDYSMPTVSLSGMWGS
ncbi:MAG: hypothetical protein LBE59_02125 [Nevskiaceae bacterium]|jgi:hypothetical protein|nr:hypothetical protein [Nevskiaceae bacterium]